MTARIAEAGEVWMEYMEFDDGDYFGVFCHYPNSTLVRRIGHIEKHSKNWHVYLWWRNIDKKVATESDAVQLLWHMAQEKGL